MLKKAIINSGIIFTGIIISRIFVFLYRLLLIRNLSVDEYATFALLSTIFIWILVFCHFNIPAGISKFISELRAQNDTFKIARYYQHAIFIGIIFSIIGGILGSMLAFSNVDKVHPLILCLFFFGLVPFSLSVINTGFLNGYGKYTWSTTITSLTGSFRFLFIVPFILFYNPLNLNIVLLLFSLALFVPSVSSFLMVKKIEEKGSDSFQYNSDISNNLFQFSKWITMTDLFNSGIILFNSYVLSLYSNIDLAVYNIVYVLYSIFSMAYGAITSSFIPHVSHAATQKNKIQLMGKKEFCFLTACTVALIVILIFIPRKEYYISMLFDNQTYSETLSYLMLLLIAIPFRVLSVSYKGTAQGMGHTKSIAFVAMVSFTVNAILLIPFYKSLGVWGAICANLSAYFVEFILSYIIVQKIVRKAN